MATSENIPMPFMLLPNIPLMFTCRNTKLSAHARSQHPYGLWSENKHGENTSFYNSKRYYPALTRKPISCSGRHGCFEVIAEVMGNWSSDAICQWFSWVLSFIQV